MGNPAGMIDAEKSPFSMPYSAKSYSIAHDDVGFAGGIAGDG